MAVQIDERDLSGVTILDLKGRLTADAIGDVTSRINDLVTGGHQKLLLNLGEVSFVDSSGLGAIVGTRSSVQSKGGKLKLLNLTSRVQDLLVTTKLEMVFETFESEHEALRSFAA